MNRNENLKALEKQLIELEHLLGAGKSSLHFNKKDTASY